AERQRVDADGRAGVLAALAQHLYEKIGGAVDDLRNVGEVRRAVDEADHLGNVLHLLEVAEGLLQDGKDVDRADPRGVPPLFDADGVAYLADEPGTARNDRHLP